MHAGRDRAAVVRPDSGGTAGKSREQENGAECGKENGSHNNCNVRLANIRKRLGE